MKFKPLPEPPATLDVLTDYRRAVPLVPADEEACRARLRRRGVESRDEARAWLTLLRALGLVERRDETFVRADGDADRAALAAAFERRVLGAAELLAALDDGPLTAGEAFAAVEVPRWERERHHDWERRWRDRTRRLCEWAVLLGLAERSGEGRYALRGGAATGER